MSVNFEKSNFALEEIKYIGFIINKHGIRANINEIQTEKFRNPKTKKQLEKMIGFFNWFHPFVPDISLKLSPLYDKLKKTSEKFTITKNDEQIITEIVAEIKR
ncbi:Pro-Pol polyprotein [Dictyocoela roeselum]|nr:Pro-Pol polyprotein [Dictyocoela roeselum]